MSVRRFVGANSRDVMRQVRETLGEDALIVANRRTEGGVEILAMADEAIDHFEPSPEPTPPESPASPPAQDPMQAMSERLLREMQDMRALLATNQSANAAVSRQVTPTGTAARLRQLLWNVGFSSELADELLVGLPEPLTALSGDSEAPLQWLRQQLMERLCVLSDEPSFFDQTGIVALVGANRGGENHHYR
ncbi:hypothetical protein HSBAA_02200 [Vreelandella sulfidaeris]|uniref:Flagellar biosynthesis protein FlhF n=1 Tax=Vreelandella sulfidaeris TaxID=115553 RepID=A0A455U5X3_9GAMM|nr:hypothetical protein HSBAA_02200 [Halomonas sulfidaeris]